MKKTRINFMNNNQCTKCGSAEVMRNVEIQDYNHLGSAPLKVLVKEAEPLDRGFFWIGRTASGALRAWICAACGFTEIYAENLTELSKIYRLNSEKFTRG